MDHNSGTILFYLSKECFAAILSDLLLSKKLQTEIGPHLSFEASIFFSELWQLSILTVNTLNGILIIE